MKKNELSQYLDEKAEELFSISQDLYNYPEISGKEKQSSEKFKMLLKEQGFRIHEFPEEELKYAFYAEYGKGHPVVGFLGEYDALPGLSQKGGSMVKEAVADSEPGHACGHNLIGTSTYASALAVKNIWRTQARKGQ